MPRGKKVCPHCGVLVKNGWAWQSHQKRHADVSASERSSDHFNDDEDASCSDHFSDGGSSCPDDEDAFVSQDEEAAVDVVGADLSVVKYLERLSEEGRLCPKHVMQYMLWGKRRSTDEGTLKTYMFLRAMYGGTGASRRQGQEMLKFIHSMGVAPAGMPTQIRDCWSLVTKVKHECLRNI